MCTYFSCPSSRLCRECTHFLLWLVQCAQFSAAQRPQIPDPGSALRVLAGVQEGGRGGKDSFPVNARGAVFLPGIAGGWQLDGGSIAARAAQRGRGPAVGGAAPCCFRLARARSAACGDGGGGARRALGASVMQYLSPFAPPRFCLGGMGVGANKPLRNTGARKGQGRVGVEGGGGEATPGRKGVRGADRMGLLRSARIQWEHSAGAAGLFKMRRAEGAERHSTELKDFFRRRSSDRVPLIG